MADHILLKVILLLACTNGFTCKKCPKPDDTILQQKLLEYKSNVSSHDSFNPFLASRNELDEIDKLGLKDILYDLVGTSNRDKSLSHSNLKPDSPLSERSTCPFTYRINYNENRYPQSLVEAKCASGSCIGIRKNQDYGCFSVPYYTKVLRKDDKECGEDSYYPSYQKLTVGCRCGDKTGP